MSYKTLAQQLETIHRHARQGSIGSRRRYKMAMLRFLRFVGGSFKLQKIGNVSNKHLAAYARYLQSRGCKETYIITELAAVRYYHDQIPGRYKLTTDNAALGVGRRGRCGNRAWTDEEFQRLVAIARIQSREWVADVLILGREMGNRIHEAVRLYRADAERALNTGALRIKGKGGKVRLVPLTPGARDALARAKNR
ncbi:MAG: integrase, partial [Candidatus Desulforudis sp.]|nr:integrase [Desulforudis sp.]